jgi:hypothetical protein
LRQDDTSSQALYAAYADWLLAAALVALVGALVARACIARGWRVVSVVVYALAAFVGSTLALLGHETMGRSSSGIDLVPAIESVLAPQMPIYGVRYLDHTLPFYLGHTLTMVEEPDELAFGVQQEPQKWLPTLAAFREQWRQGPHALALMSPATFAALGAQGLAMQLIARDTRRVVVANFRPGTP